ncbi:MAG: urea ABC transporter permease subunit UrtC [Planctomycetota bacterium]|nr:MAG: urea ABC transporter permease subunit UrtC [Planctomycetota bacterium]
MNKYVEIFGGREWIISFLILAVVLLLALPIFLGEFHLNLAGRFLSFAFVAIGLVLCWGHGGILSLGQGLFWGLGGYCMAAFLKLEAAANIAKEEGSDQVRALTTVGIPDFMDWNQITSLPWFWYPFKSFPVTVLLIFLLPTLLAFIIGWVMFKRRVVGVYFAIITQATILFVTSQGYTGGINGITDLRTLLGWDIRDPSAQNIIYFMTAVSVLACVLVGRLITGSKLGRLLVAVRDSEDRVRFSGYDVANLKAFVFCVAAAMCGLGGALFVMNVGFISPTTMGIEPSILMVIYCAVGGRMSLIGAVYGTLLVLFGRMIFAEQFPTIWLFFMGSLFILVTLVFPEGLAGIWQRQVKPVFAKLTSRLRSPPPAPPTGGAEVVVEASSAEPVTANDTAKEGQP